MKNVAFHRHAGLLGLIWFLLIPAWALAQPQSPLFFMDICRFQDFRRDDPLVEIYFSVDASTVLHERRSDEQYHAAVNIDWLIQKLEAGDSIAVFSSNFTLDWPQGAYPEDTARNLLRRNLFYAQDLEVEPGNYLLQAIVRDMNNPNAQASVAVNEFQVEQISASSIAFSDVKWVASQRYVEGQRRDRDDLFPLVTNDAFINQDTMVFYQEIYNVDKLREGDFFIRARFLQGDNVLFQYEQTQGRRARSINAYLMAIPGLEKLPSNIYYLQIELLDGRSQVFSTFRKKFYVYNSRLEQGFPAIAANNREADIFNEYDEQELDYYLATLAWISTEQERQFTRVLETYEQKKNYLLGFWEKRKRYPTQEVLALWRGHLMALDYVNQEFTSQLREGWRTDRGRVFLKYGIPSDVERYPNNTNMVPYEIWRYDRLGAQTNVIFVFYDPDMASDEYPLLHSSKYGEVYNPRWQEQVADRQSVHTPTSIDFERNTRNGQNPYREQLDPNN